MCTVLSLLLPPHCPQTSWRALPVPAMADPTQESQQRVRVPFPSGWRCFPGSHAPSTARSPCSGPNWCLLCVLLQSLNPRRHPRDVFQQKEPLWQKEKVNSALASAPSGVMAKIHHHFFPFILEAAAPGADGGGSKTSRAAAPRIVSLALFPPALERSVG